MPTTIKLRRGTKSEWDSANPVLAVGEPGLITDTGEVRTGDGTTAFNSLPDTNRFLSEDILSGTYRKDAAAIWVSPPGAISSGSPALTTVQQLTPAYTMDPDNIEGVCFGVWLPDSWSTYDVEFWWANAGTGSGDVEWGYLRKNITEGEDSSAASSSTIVDTAGSQNVTQRVTVATGVTNDADEMLSVLARRVASSSGDTLGNDAYFIGARLTKAS